MNEQTTPAMLGGVPIKNSRDVINEDTRICCLTYGLPKSGKTSMLATFDKWCRDTYGKPGLCLAFEAAEGGGITTIRDSEVLYAQPPDLKATEAMLRGLMSDTQFAAVYVDNLTDLVKNIVQPYALTFPSREHIATRVAGVPERSDYQTMGEKTRVLLNMMIALTKTSTATRKHLIVNALRAEKRDNNNNLEYVGPDLPGALREFGAAPFELVASIEIKMRVVPDPNNPKATIRQQQHLFNTKGDGVKVAGDRYKVFPGEAPADWYALMEQYWKPAIFKKEAASAATP